MLYGGYSNILFVSTIVLLIPTFFFSGLRFWIRFSRQNQGLDDLFLAIGLIFLTWMIQCNLSGTLHGVGIWDASRLPPLEQIQAAKWFTLAQLSFLIAQYFIKISIAITQARIATVNRTITWMIWGISIIFTLMCGITFTYILTRCHPVAASWNPLIPGASCAKFTILTNLSYANSAILLLTDWFLAILPVFFLWNVQINRKTKVGACVLLGLGIFASITGIVRLKYTIDLETSKHSLYDVGKIILWAYVEACISTIAVSCMCLRPLFLSLLKSLGLSEGSGAQTTRKSTTKPGKAIFGNRSRNHRFDDTDPASSSQIHGLDFLQKSAKANVTNVYADTRLSSSAESDSESRRKILDSDIRISQDVDVTYEVEPPGYREH